jgi:hypothetical protein
VRVWFTSMAVVLGTGLAAYPLAAAPEGRATWAAGAAGVACMAAALTVRRARWLGLGAVLLLALHYAAALHAGHVGLDVYAPLVAIVLYVFAESMDIAIALADVAPMTRPALTTRLITNAIIAVGGGGLALVAVLARSLFGGAFASVVVGAVCILGVVALPLWLAQRADT